MPRMTITVGWAEIERRPACDPGTIRVDIGERVPMEDVVIGHAVVWLNAGTAADVAKAEAWAATQEGHQVFTFPTTEPDPLGETRRQVEAPMTARTFITRAEQSPRMTTNYEIRVTDAQTGDTVRYDFHGDSLALAWDHAQRLAQDVWGGVLTFPGIADPIVTGFRRKGTHRWRDVS